MDYNKFSHSEKPFEKREIWETKYDELQIEQDLKAFIDEQGNFHS